MAILFIGANGLAGWISNQPLLACPSECCSPISSITAILLCVVAALSLLTTFPPSRTRRWLSGSLALVLLGAGAWTLIAYAGNTSLPFDAWFGNRELIRRIPLQRNRMSPQTAASFVLFGTAILAGMLRRKKGHLPAQALATSGLLLMLVTATGYLYSIAALVSISELKPIAPQTTAALLLGFVSLFLATPEKGAVRTILSQERGGLLARRLIVFVIVLPLMLGGITSAGSKLGLLPGPTSIFFLTAAMVVSLASLLLFNSFTINQSEQARREARRALEESERTYRTIFESAGDPMFIVNQDLTVLEANSLACLCLGKSLQELKGRPFADAAGSSCALEMALKMREALARQYASFDSCCHTPDGREVPLEIHAQVVQYHGKTAILTIARDLTERRKSERALAEKESLLQQSQKMEAVGRLAGGVAHDFNNLLTVILGYAEMLSKRLHPSSEERREALQIKLSAERAAAVTRQLLAFSRRQPASPRDTDLNTVLDEIKPLLEKVVGEKTRLSVRPRARRPNIRIDTHQLEQVILNLVINARDAMPDGGILSIESRDYHTDQDPQPFIPTPPRGTYVELFVADTGVGISAEIVPHIFEPFFTTKDAAKGTGLGLSIVYGIVTQNNGAIGVTTAPHAGTVMRVLFPSTPKESSRQDDHMPPLALDQIRAGTLLLVEDDQPVRTYLAEGLRKVGFSVLEAETGEEALRISEGRSFAVDAVISDVVMPGMGGVRLAAELAQRIPGVRILLISGYGESCAPELGSLGGRFNLITKPFTVADVVELLHDVVT